MPILPGLVAGVSQTSMLKIFLKQKDNGRYNTAYLLVMDQADCDLTKHMEYIMRQNCIKEDGQDFVCPSQDLVYTARHSGSAQLLVMLHERSFAMGIFIQRII